MLFVTDLFNVHIYNFEPMYAICNRFTLMNLFYLHRVIGTPSRSPPHSKVTSRKSRQSTRLRRLTLRTMNQARPTVHVNPATGRGSGSYKDNFHSYLGVITREKIPIVHSNCKDVPKSLKDLVL